MKLWAPALIALTLVGCNKPSAGPPGPGTNAASDAERAAPAAADAAQAKPAAPAPPNSSAASPSGLPMLAYVYDYSLEIPTARLRPLVESEADDCTRAGPEVCQVTGTSIHETGRDHIAADLSLRATAAWIAKFKTTLAADVGAAKGRIARTEITSDDLSRQVVDTEAAIRAKTTLRDRLQEILQTRPGKLSDLVDVENTLAGVQGELDATQSELNAMRQRVAMSEVKISYQSGGVFAPEGAWSPVADAAHGVVGDFAVSLGVVITLIGVIVPWALILAGGAWLGLAVKHRLRQERIRADKLAQTAAS